jgi:hypothetical protein
MIRLYGSAPGRLMSMHLKYIRHLERRRLRSPRCAATGITENSLRRTVFSCSVFLVALALGACSGKTTPAADASNPSQPKAAARDTTAPLYPDWARAVVPPYKNAVVGILVNSQPYQFQSTDDRATVAAWYKSHVNGSWASDATTGNLSTTVNGVKISIYTNSAGAHGPVKTMIALSHG